MGPLMALPGYSAIKPETLVVVLESVKHGRGRLRRLFCAEAIALLGPSTPTHVAVAALAGPHHDQ